MVKRRCHSMSLFVYRSANSRRLKPMKFFSDNSWCWTLRIIDIICKFKFSLWMITYTLFSLRFNVSCVSAMSRGSVVEFCAPCALIQRKFDQYFVLSSEHKSMPARYDYDQRFLCLLVSLFICVVACCQSLHNGFITYRSWMARKQKYLIERSSDGSLFFCSFR